jgi:hypothetical protein
MRPHAKIKQNIKQIGNKLFNRSRAAPAPPQHHGPAVGRHDRAADLRDPSQFLSHFPSQFPGHLLSQFPNRRPIRSDRSAPHAGGCVTAAGIAGIERRQARLRMQMRTIANDPQEKPCPSAGRKENGLRSLARPLHRHNCMLRSARVQMGGREHERVPWKHLAAEAAGDGSELPREDLGASRTVPPTPVGVAAGVHEGDALQPRAPRARAQRRITGEVHLDGCRDPSGAGFGFVIVV